MCLQTGSGYGSGRGLYNMVKILRPKSKPFSCLLAGLFGKRDPNLSVDHELLHDILGVRQLIDHKEHIACIHADRPIERLLEQVVADHRLPVAVEGHAEELALAVEDRASGVSPGDVEVRDKGDRDIVERRVGVPAEILLLPEA